MAATPYLACASACPPSTAANPTINNNSMPGRLYLDANVNYMIDFGKDSTGEFFFSVKNALNANPPLLLSDTFGSNLYDTLGVVFRAGVRVKL
jgi:outer membrane receptor protein involved in Fe transport